MQKAMGLTGEASDHKVAGIFDSESSAGEAVEAIRRSAALDKARVLLIRPGEKEPGRSLEPESRGIWHTLIRAHVWLGLAGAVAGGLIFIVLMLLDIAFVTQNQTRALWLLVIFCGIGGLMLGGALTLRPDHSPYIAKARTALNDGKFVVTVHALQHAQLDDVEATLRKHGGETIRTL